MGLTATEQLKLINGEVKPPETDLLELTHQTAVIYAKSFYDTYKEFDGATYPLAQEYLNKMFGVSNGLLHNYADVIDRVNRMVIVIIGDVAPSLAVVENANQTQWEGFVLDQMDEALEYVSGVKRNEKEEYMSL